MSDLGRQLFQSETRAALLELLFVAKLSGSISDLARRSSLSPRSVGKEVDHLQKMGLVFIDTVGSSDLIRANLGHPAASFIRGLLLTPANQRSDLHEALIYESLAAWGAPLAGVHPKRHFGLIESILGGLVEARSNGTLLRVLPTVVAKNATQLDWIELKRDARRAKLKAELGWLVEVTSELMQSERLLTYVEDLHDRRRRVRRFFPEAKSSFEMQLARKRSSKIARRWGFWMNISDGSLSQAFERHNA